MTYAVCNAVTRTVSNGVCRSVQNQNQNQTVVKGFCGSPLANASIHRFGSRGLAADKRMDAFGVESRGVR